MAYEAMASVYDHLMSDAPYDQWVNFTENIFKNENKPVQGVVDLGCGTGRITVKMASLGYEMTGVDLSPDMLSQADRHAAEKSINNVQWICQDLRDLKGIENMDAAISYCDVMNYITTEEELYQVFKNTAAALKPNGLFLFDIHSMFHVDHHCINQTFADVTDTSSYIWFCIEGDMPGEMFHDLTFFTRSGDVYYKFTEMHHQRTFPVGIYKQLLNRAGFKYCHLYGDFSLESGNVSEESERLFIVARKKV